MDILDLPVEWQEYIIGLERAADMSRDNANVAIAICVVLFATVLFLMKKMADAPPRQPHKWLPERPTRHEVMISDLQRIVRANRQAVCVFTNQLYAQNLEAKTDFDNGVYVLDDVIFVSGVVAACGPEFAKQGDMKKRWQIMDDVKSGNGIAFRMHQLVASDAPTDVKMTVLDADELDAWFAARRELPEV